MCSSDLLEKLLPLDLLRTLVSRPELDSFQSRLTWTKSQMEHARGSAQALALAGGSPGKDASGDVLMGAVAGGGAAAGREPLLWSLPAERGRAEQEGDWSRAAVLTDTIQSLAKGGKGGKGGPKGNPRAGFVPSGSKGGYLGGRGPA